MKKLGLIGKNISYSFSQNYFTQKFKSENLEAAYQYQNFDIPSIEEFTNILAQNPDLIGCNVTIPYKEAIIPFLDELSENAKSIGAVNTIKMQANGKLLGDNTDFYGFTQSITPLLQDSHRKALILGTGGAAKAIAFALEKLGIVYRFVSRASSVNSLTYKDLDAAILKEFTIIINCTPLGTSPNIEDCPDIPFAYISDKHLVYDLIYNPAKTKLLLEAEKKGAITKNGLAMLEFQAEKAWEIWNG